MKENPVIAIGVIVILACAVFASTRNAESDEDGIIADAVDAVSGQRMNQTVMDLESFGTRAFYLTSADNISSYIYDRFLQTGLHVEYQEFMVGSQVCRNVIARTEGFSETEDLFLFGAHYDSTNMLASTYQLGESLPAPGADDDASGVASVIELATIASGLDLHGTVKFVAFAAEELRYDGYGGLKGSEAFVNHEKSQGVSYRGAAVLDMVGYQGSGEKHTVLITNGASGPLLSAVEDSVSKFGLDLDVRIYSNSSVSFSDHYPFWEAGYPCFLAIETMPGETTEYGFNPHYHTAYDTSEFVSEGQLSDVTKALLGALLELDGKGDREYPAALVVGITLIASAAIVIYIYVKREKAGRT